MLRGLVWLLFVVTALLIGCGDDESGTEDNPLGTEGGACYPNGTCNAGLTCFSNLCVDATGDSGGPPSGGSGGTPGTGGATGSGGASDGGPLDGGASGDASVGTGGTGGASGAGGTGSGGIAGTGGVAGTGGTGGVVPSCGTPPSPNCSPSLTDCGGTCVNVLTDPSHCGACGAACPVNQYCENGVCVARCTGIGIENFSCFDYYSDCGPDADACRTPIVPGCTECTPATTLTVCTGGITPTGDNQCGKMCIPGLVSCDWSCVNLRTDSRHCGGCYCACAPGEVCLDGACRSSSECTPSKTDCGGVCADLRTNPNHCGACGNACATGKYCQDGVCVDRCSWGYGEYGFSCHPYGTADFCERNCAETERVCDGTGYCAKACEHGLTSCDRSCVNLLTDPFNCGACYNKCAPGEQCMDGVCRSGCRPMQTDCGGACVDLLTNVSHCGACGNACPFGHSCQEGVCRIGCDTQHVEWSGGCFDWTQDPSHCGSSSWHECAHPLAVCDRQGQCAIACPEGLTTCDRTCVNPRADSRHCGACYNKCAADETCVDGACWPNSQCTPSKTNCGGACVDLRSDPNNCGACGTACLEPMVCMEGVCSTQCDWPYSAANRGCFNTAQNGYACAGYQPTDCAARDEVCDSGVVPSASNGCVSACRYGLTSCDHSCVNFRIDPHHCGGCYNACAPTERCNDGVCRPKSECTPSKTDCGGVCTDLRTDPSNCGACGNACPVNQYCLEGRCSGDCGQGGFYLARNFACYDTRTDGYHCDVSGLEECERRLGVCYGGCVPACPQGLTSCDRSCVNLRIDPHHCGECYQECGPGRRCDDGVCRP